MTPPPPRPPRSRLDLARGHDGPPLRAASVRVRGALFDRGGPAPGVLVDGEQRGGAFR